MRGRLGYPSDTCLLNNRSIAFNSTGRRGVHCDGSNTRAFILSMPSPMDGNRSVVIGEC